MFGLLQPCRHRLGPELHRVWTGHLCGMCLSAGRTFGQAARATTNHDGLLLSVLVTAQRPVPVPVQRAPRCPLRGMRPAEVVTPDDDAARFAAAVSVLLAGTKLGDKVADGDLPPPARPAARELAGRWTRAGAAALAAVGLTSPALTDVLERQAAAEAAAGPGDLLSITAATEEASAVVAAHTAVLAGRPANAEPLAEVGRMFGRLAHLLDAVTDLDADRRRGAWNPLPATGSDLVTARLVADDALARLDGALAAVDLADPVLTRALLGQELPRRVNRVFGSRAEPGGLRADTPDRRRRKRRWCDRCDCDCCDCGCCDGGCCDCDCGCSCCDC